MKQSIKDELTAHVKDMILSGKLHTYNYDLPAVNNRCFFHLTDTYKMGNYMAENWLKLHDITRQQANEYLYNKAIEYGAHPDDADYSNSSVSWIVESIVFYVGDSFNLDHIRSDLRIFDMSEKGEPIEELSIEEWDSQTTEIFNKNVEQLLYCNEY